MWIALLTGATLQVRCPAAAEAPARTCSGCNGSALPLSTCNPGKSGGREHPVSARPNNRFNSLHSSSARRSLKPPATAPLQAVVYAKAPAIVAYLSGGDAGVASLAVLYLRARSWGLPGALVMMVAIGAGRWAPPGLNSMCRSCQCCNRELGGSAFAADAPGCCRFAGITACGSLAAALSPLTRTPLFPASLLSAGASKT